MSTASTAPRNAAKAYISATVIAPAEVRTASARATASWMDWVPMRVARFGRRSASTPPKSENTRAGAKRIVMVKPKASGEFVRCSTRSASAVSCIQVPANETNWPTQKRR